MVRKVGPPSAPAATGDVDLSLTRTEALALVKIAETGLGVTDLLKLIPNTSTAARALDKLKEVLR